MKTDPSSENPSAAPDKSHQAAEKTNTSVQTFIKLRFTSRISLDWRILKDRRCKSQPAEILKIQQRSVTWRNVEVWSSPPGEPSVTLASYPPRSPWIAALTCAVLLWLKKQGRGRKRYNLHQVVHLKSYKWEVRLVTSLLQKVLFVCLCDKGTFLHTVSLLLKLSATCSCLRRPWFDRLYSQQRYWWRCGCCSNLQTSFPFSASRQYRTRNLWDRHHLSNLFARCCTNVHMCVSSTIEPQQMINLFMKRIDDLTYMMWENTDNHRSHFSKGQGDVINLLFCETNCKYPIHIEGKQHIFRFVEAGTTDCLTGRQLSFIIWPVRFSCTDTWGSITSQLLLIPLRCIVKCSSGTSWATTE